MDIFRKKTEYIPFFKTKKFSSFTRLKNSTSLSISYSFNNILGFRQLRIYFLFNRNLLKELSRISWEVIGDYYRSTCIKDGASPAAVAVIQTSGDYLSFNPHIHILTADGCFGCDGFFYAPSISIDTASLEKLFVHKIFKMFLFKGLITERVIELMGAWKHTGFEVYCGKRICPSEKRSTENLARYIIRASFSQERMKYFI